MIGAQCKHNHKSVRNIRHPSPVNNDSLHPLMAETDTE